ncbi:TPA: GNAT family N-acetyltransferase [Streptococcus equi subsp. zooepidemicus]|uniref:GNAT family N-acetyltransferase n=1 Tax=Streptococcus equi TaxID=1336 RepID=UPI0005B6FE74|nr:GNAT family N-acetyltransferase [Streptococcus equi]KIS13463.1 acetyltransferase (GNAT) family protein [Streptococcus equi subsp. zooepidemicus Sz105]VED85331.1 acetyltransferase (GNAT) family protein [Streptococcus equi subsp. equi]KIQ75976.1 GCN5 family acetyltransferase [Streptococcus equi subsp. zooepidemicus]KIS08431.1 acetyltransferase (GNAT) family protein [Streptococcus equi subsp. zooepidemicus Sz5]KIS11842.1 acetyltransferase (GNAT) family protein [Streptococcus equi subsp. zooepi
MWVVKAFDQLTRDELFAIYKERVAVFVVEQQCPYPDIDDLDQKAIHLFKQVDSELRAYCRLIPTDNSIKLGRVLVAQKARRTGLGRDLVHQALAYCQQHFPKLPVYAQAQAYLEPFYSSFGFKAVSEIYLEDNIPHIDMIKN